MEKLENRVIIDTNVLVNFLRKKPEEVELLLKLRDSNLLGATDINAFELYYGAYKSIKQDENLAATKGLLNTLFLAGTSEDSMEMAAKIISGLEKKDHPIDMRDLFIASICLTGSFKLLTRNKKHFENIEGLALV